MPDIAKSSMSSEQGRINYAFRIRGHGRGSPRAVRGDPKRSSLLAFLPREARRENGRMAKGEGAAEQNVGSVSGRCSRPTDRVVVGGLVCLRV